MPTCLLGLGSNIGDSEATLRAAIADITALPDIQLTRHSEWYRTKPLGGPAGQPDYVNGAAIVETKIPPLRLLAELQQIENRHGRTRNERWAPRTLDIDLLLYGSEVSETEMLTVPHPRLTFRRFVLDPAAAIAPKMLHPIIGWPIERFLLHLQQASNVFAITSPSHALRELIEASISKQRRVRVVTRPTFETADHHWPSLWTTWFEPLLEIDAPPIIATSPVLPYAAAMFPKLSILLDGDVAHRGADKLQWSTLVRQPGRGPTVRLQSQNQQEIDSEVLAAVDSVWPDLGPTS